MADPRTARDSSICQSRNVRLSGQSDIGRSPFGATHFGDGLASFHLFSFQRWYRDLPFFPVDLDFPVVNWFFIYLFVFFFVFPSNRSASRPRSYGKSGPDSARNVGGDRAPPTADVTDFRCDVTTGEELLDWPTPPENRYAASANG